MKSKLFVVSELTTPETSDTECVVLDNVILQNNPEISQLEVHECRRKSKKDWTRYENQIASKYKKYLPILSTRLNFLNGVDNDTKYWKMLFYRGLKRYITLAYEFYVQVEDRFEPNEHDFSLLHKSSFYTPSDFEALRGYLSSSQLANEQLFAIYIESRFPNLILNYKGFRKYKPYFETHVPAPTLKHSILYFLYEKLKFLKPKIILLGVGYKTSKIYKLILKSKFKIFLHILIPFVRNSVSINSSHRLSLSEKEKNFDNFDVFFFKTFKSLWPSLYLEDYLVAAKHYDNQVRKFPEAKYLISELWPSSSSMSFFIAQIKKNSGVKFINSEHRGMTHIFENSEFKETLEFCDSYFTVGWYEKCLDKDLKLVNTGLLNNVIINSKEVERYNNKILYFAAPIYAKRTNYFNDNFFMGEDSKYALEFQHLFFANLNQDLLKSMVYRTAPIVKKGNIAIYDQINILKEFTELMEIDDHSFTGLEAMNSAKLVIIDYIGSGYLESLTHNIPTIIFLCENAYLSKEGVFLFQELLDVNIVHDNALEASEFVMSIANDPLLWWKSSKVQKARKSFLHKTIGDASVLENKILNLL